MEILNWCKSRFKHTDKSESHYINENSRFLDDLSERRVKVALSRREKSRSSREGEHDCRARVKRIYFYDINVSGETAPSFMGAMSSARVNFIFGAENPTGKFDVYRGRWEGASSRQSQWRVSYACVCRRLSMILVLVFSTFFSFISIIHLRADSHHSYHIERFSNIDHYTKYIQKERRIQKSLITTTSFSNNKRTKRSIFRAIFRLISSPLISYTISNDKRQSLVMLRARNTHIHTYTYTTEQPQIKTKAIIEEIEELFLYARRVRARVMYIVTAKAYDIHIREGCG